MARLPYPDESALPPKVREALDAVPPLNIFRMLSHAETVFRPYLRFGGALLRDMQLDPLVRELAILQVARVHEAQYEWIQHVPIARAVGMTDAQLAALEAGQLDAEAFDETQRIAITFTDALQRAPRPCDEHFAALQRVLSPREIVELILVTGAYAMLARLMTATDLDLDEPLGEQVLASASSRG
jgi:4-carboxymuconolactone decarboxylase